MHITGGLGSRTTVWYYLSHHPWYVPILIGTFCVPIHWCGTDVKNLKELIVTIGISTMIHSLGLYNLPSAGQAVAVALKSHLYYPGSLPFSSSSCSSCTWSSSCCLLLYSHFLLKYPPHLHHPKCLKELTMIQPLMHNRTVWCPFPPMENCSLLINYLLKLLLQRKSPSSANLLWAPYFN